MTSRLLVILTFYNWNIVQDSKLRTRTMTWDIGPLCVVPCTPPIRPNLHMSHHKPPTAVSRYYDSHVSFSIFTPLIMLLEHFKTKTSSFFTSCAEKEVLENITL